MTRHGMSKTIFATGNCPRWDGAPHILHAEPRQGTGQTHRAITATQSGIIR